MAGAPRRRYHAAVARLFEEHDAGAAGEDVVAVPAGPNARVVGVAVAANVWKTFDYVWPDALGEPEREQVRCNNVPDALERVRCNNVPDAPAPGSHRPG